MLFTVYHPQGGAPALPIGPQPDWPTAYATVGTVEADHIEAAFDATNDSPQWPVRSTSPGDVLADDRGNVWRCTSFGWHRLPVFDLELMIDTGIPRLSDLPDDEEDHLCDGCDEEASLDRCPLSDAWLCRRCCARCNAEQCSGACLYATAMHWED